MIKNLIFDLVGVIGDFGTKQIFQHFIELGATDVWELNNEMDLGRLTGEEFLKAVHERCMQAAKERGAEGVTLTQLHQEYVAPMTLPKEHLEKLCSLRQKYRVFLLSNVGDMHWEQLVRTMSDAGYRVEDCFDEVFPSFRTHVNKPAAAAYQNVLNTAGLKTEETMFFDDAPVNVSVAQSLGIRGILIHTQFPNPQILGIE